MSNYLPLLFLLACPLMMIFMMHGMHGGHDQGAERREPPQDKQPSPNDADASQRILDLERQVEELRAERDRFGGPARRQ